MLKPGTQHGMREEKTSFTEMNLFRKIERKIAIKGEMYFFLMSMRRGKDAEKRKQGESQNERFSC